MGGNGGAGGMPVDICTMPPGSEPVEGNSLCTFKPPPGDLAPVVKWAKDAFTIGPAYNQVIVTPVVGNLDDDNGDGMIGPGDIPDIVFTAYTGSTGWFNDGYLRALSGADGSELWGVPGVRGAAGVAMGDVDGNGAPEVFTVDNGGNLRAFDHQGNDLWSCPAGAGAYGYPAIANADGQGTAEILVGSSVCTSDGKLLVTTALNHNWYFGALDFYSPTSFFTDLDQDGTMEIVSGAGVSRLDGSTMWIGPGGHAAVADFDLPMADPNAPEVVIVRGGIVSILNGLTGAEVWSRSGVLDQYGGPPTVADFDGDGKAEIGVAASSIYAVFNPDDPSGVLWTAPIQDKTSYVTGSSVFDFNGDGNAEVVYADEQTLWVFDGKTGTPVVTLGDHVSATYHEYPVMADVDADGHVDIVLASNNGYFGGPWTGIRVFSGMNNDWASGRPVWNEHAYHITNVNDDLSIPVTEKPHWKDRNSFREGGFGELGALSAADLVPVILGHCAESCPETDRVVFRFENRGAIAAQSGVPYAVVGIAMDGTRTVLAAGTVQQPIEAGFSTPAMDVSIEATEAAKYASMVLIVDNDGMGFVTTTECDENNNEVTVPEICPEPSRPLSQPRR